MDPTWKSIGTTILGEIQNSRHSQIILLHQAAIESTEQTAVFARSHTLPIDYVLLCTVYVTVI